MMSEDDRSNFPVSNTGVRSIVITVDDAHLDRIEDVADHLRDLGVQVDEILKATGLICGSTDRRLSDLTNVRGVLSVEDQPTFELPPPDSPVH